MELRPSGELNKKKMVETGMKFQEDECGSELINFFSKSKNFANQILF